MLALLGFVVFLVALFVVVMIMSLREQRKVEKQGAKG
jgi:preprotein translocase subunit YajC